MKYMRYLLSVIILLFLIGGVKVSAVNTGFTTKPLAEEERDRILPNINISLMKTEPVRGSIECFDVNDSEMIAIGQSKGDRIEMCICSQDGIFMHGYTLSDNGPFGVE